MSTESVLKVSELWIYPIKSCRGIAVEQFTLDDRGPEHDRRWMLVDGSGRFLSQRQVPRMALIDVALDGDWVRVSAPGMNDLAFDRAAANATAACTVWRDKVELEHVSAEADAWFSEFLRIACGLMHMPCATQRVVDPDYAPERRLVSLADAFPMLLIGAASLDLLNTQLARRNEVAVPMKRFRPNVVVTGTRPHEEDEWREIRIGEVDCKVVKPCARCATTTVDVATGIPGVEPLRTLATYRKQGSKVFFGQNVIHLYPGAIHVGEDVVVSINRQAESEPLL